MVVQISDLQEQDLESAARLWQQGWHDAHAEIVPSELVELRTPQSFLHRLESNMTTARVSVEDGRVLGLCMTKEDELYQMYVATEARGTGLARVLMIDAETRLKHLGCELAWLACAVGNDRAARFYEKAGWRNAGTRSVELETTRGAFPLEVWRYEKRLL